MDAQVARSRPHPHIILSPSLHTQQERTMTELEHTEVIVNPCSYGKRAVVGQHLVDELASLSSAASNTLTCSHDEAILLAIRHYSL